MTYYKKACAAKQPCTRMPAHPSHMSLVRICLQDRR